MTSDRELVQRYRGGDQEAFRELYFRHRRPLFFYLLSIVRSRDTAEELLQETFYSFLRSLDRLDGSANVRPYLVRAARNRAIDHLRRARRDGKARERRAADVLFQARAGGAVAREPLLDPDEASALLERLPAGQREVIVLRVFVGVTFREIAEVLGCPEPSAVSRYRYGLEKLRTMLKGDLLKTER